MVYTHKENKNFGICSYMECREKAVGLFNKKPYCKYHFNYLKKENLYLMRREEYKNKQSRSKKNAR